MPDPTDKTITVQGVVVKKDKDDEGLIADFPADGTFVRIIGRYLDETQSPFAIVETTLDAAHKKTTDANGAFAISVTVPSRGDKPEIIVQLTETNADDSPVVNETTVYFNATQPEKFIRLEAPSPYFCLLYTSPSPRDS